MLTAFVVCPWDLSAFAPVSGCCFPWPTVEVVNSTAGCLQQAWNHSLVVWRECWKASLGTFKMHGRYYCLGWKEMTEWSKATMAH